jgi:hypothetical protein
VLCVAVNATGWPIAWEIFPGNAADQKALVQVVGLLQRLEERENKVPWPDLMRDLGQVQSVLVELDGQRYQLRTDLVGAAYQAFAAAGVRPPSPVTHLGPVVS